VLSLQAEIKSLRGKLAHEKAQAIPPSEREAKLRQTIAKLSARLRNVVNTPPRGTLIMSRRDKLKIVSSFSAATPSRFHCRYKSSGLPIPL
jgi:hypothetical protein